MQSFVMVRGRVDPAKTLGLIKRIQAASGVAPVPAQPMPVTVPVARVG